jgi:hypothetical protein
VGPWQHFVIPVIDCHSEVPSHYQPVHVRTPARTVRPWLARPTASQCTNVLILCICVTELALLLPASVLNLLEGHGGAAAGPETTALNGSALSLQPQLESAVSVSLIVDDYSLV